MDRVDSLTYCTLSNGGTSWTTSCQPTVTGNSYTWNVNNTPTTSMRVRVRDDQNNCRRDDSNGNNTIIAATPVLTSPNGGENWKVNSTQNITWNTATVHTSLLIEFSADNGVNWNVITTAGTQYRQATLGLFRTTLQLRLKLGLVTLVHPLTLTSAMQYLRYSCQRLSLYHLTVARPSGLAIPKLLLGMLPPWPVT
jgi:hypothetical protein